MEIYSDSFGMLHAVELSFGDHVKYTKLNKNQVVIIGYNSCYALVLPNKVISFLENCVEETIDMSELLEKKADDKLLTRAADVISVDMDPGYELQSTDGTVSVYVKKKYINKFPGCKFYANAPNDRILVKGPGGSNEVVGIVMPFVVQEEGENA